jgi:serine/threonine protein kinase
MVHVGAKVTEKTMSGRYRILEQIGEGGLGIIYRAYDTQLERDVAVKRVMLDAKGDSKGVVASLRAEAKKLSSLKHPHIVTVHDVGEDEEGPFIVMELLEGETLDEIVARGALELRDFRRLAMQTLEAMVAAEARGLLHRDLKPANLMLVWLPSGKFQVKILDFGLAGFSRVPTTQTADQGGSIMGSIYFMAPEQFERRPLDVRTDLYSIGTIFYYALSACYPFPGEDPSNVMQACMAHRYVPLADFRPDLPSAVCAWVEWLFAFKMEDRPANARIAMESFGLELAIDESQLREAAGGKREVAAELLESFVEEINEILPRIEAALAADDGVTAVELARHVRGTAVTLGYREISTIASRIEHDAVVDPAGSLAVFAGFRAAMDRLREAVRQITWKAAPAGETEQGGEL